MLIGARVADAWPRGVVDAAGNPGNGNCLVITADVVANAIDTQTGGVSASRSFGKIRGVVKGNGAFRERSPTFGDKYEEMKEWFREQGETGSLIYLHTRGRGGLKEGDTVFCGSAWTGFE